MFRLRREEGVETDLRRCAKLPPESIWGDIRGSLVHIFSLHWIIFRVRESSTYSEVQSRLVKISAPLERSNGRDFGGECHGIPVGHHLRKKKSGTRYEIWALHPRSAMGGIRAPRRKTTFSQRLPDPLIGYGKEILFTKLGMARG